MRFRDWSWPWTERKSGVTTLELFKQIMGGTPSLTGENVTWKTAFQVSTALACGRVIANGISQVPLKLFREEGTKRLPAKDHSLYRLLHRKPNAWQTSFEFRQMLGLHLVFAGNHYSFKNIVNGKIVELVPFEPHKVAVKQNSDYELTYRVTFDNGKTQEFSADVIWHVRGLSWNGYLGMEPVKLAREALGLSMATERQHAQMHRNGVSPSGAYSVDDKLNPEQYKQLRKFIIEHNSDGGPLLLDRGAKWMQLAMTGVDAQHLETRRFQVEEVCRAMGVMPIMVFSSDKATTYASAEQMFLAHVVHTLSPWYECIEQSIDCNLLTEKDDRDGIYAKFIEEGLLRGSIETTANMLDKYVNGGLMTPNEGRAKLDMNPDPDPASDKLRVPANIVGKQPAPKTEPQPNPAPQGA